MKLILTLLALIVLAIPISTKSAIADDSYKTNDLQQAYKAYLEEREWSIELTSYSETLIGKRTGQCVLAIRKYYSVPKNEVQGLAKNTKPNTQTPKVGSVIIFKNMSWAGHVGIVIDVYQDKVIYFDSNGDWKQKGAIREINKNDKRITGYKIINY